MARNKRNKRNKTAVAINAQKAKPATQAQRTRDMAEGSLTGVRSSWGAVSVASGLTPSALAGIIRDANAGNLYAYLTLAEEMEERDPHYSSVLRTRKLAVLGLDVKVEPASDSAEDIRLADEIKALVRSPKFEDLQGDLLDALGKGYAVAEIEWQRGAKWIPTEYKFRDPRFFAPDINHPETFRIIDESDPVNGLAMPAGKFIIHKPKLKSGLSIRGGLARLVAFSYVCKMYGIKDWLAFAEIYGIPLRVGKYDSNATDADISILRNAVSSIGSDAAAVLPEDMQIEFEQIASAASGSDVFEKLVSWIDRQVSKAVLGQTMTSDDGSSKSQASVHNEVRKELIEADAKQLAQTINRDLVKPFIDWNFGPRENYPRISIRLPEKEDLISLATNVEKLIKSGLHLDADEVREKFGFSKPKEGAETLGK